MNKTLVVFSGILVVIGVCNLFFTRLINLVLPKIGYAAFQASAAGSYNPAKYVVDFSGLDTASIILIVLGIFSGYYFYKKDI